MQFSYSETAIVQEKFIGFINMNLGGGNTIHKLLVNSEKFDVSQAYLHGLTAGQTTFNQKGTEFLENIFPKSDFDAGFFFQEAKKLLSAPQGKFPIDWDVVGNAGYSISGYPTPIRIDYPLWRIPIYPNKRLTLISVKKTAGAEVK